MISTHPREKRAWPGPAWDAPLASLRQSGMTRGGGRVLDRRNRRDRTTSRGIERLQLYANRRLYAEVHANLMRLSLR
jgi:hypothetical protein